MEKDGGDHELGIAKMLKPTTHMWVWRCQDVKTNNTHIGIIAIIAKMLKPTMHIYTLTYKI
jgi:hypothetical protein